MSSGKKIKSTRIKSTRSAAAPPAAAENKPSSPASSSYRRPGSPPAPVAKKKGGIPASVIILIVVIVFILGMVGWFVSQLMKYGFKTAEENHSYYLFQVANTGEREAYQSLINHSKTEYTLSQAEDVLAEANQFLKDYPSSLFAREPSTLKTTKQWAILYQVPLEMELLADKLPGTGQPWVAEIRDLRNTLFRQKFILHCRKQDMEAEQTTIEKNAAIFDFQQEKIKVWNELRDFSDGFMRRYEQRARELSSQMQSNLGAFQTEKQTVREKIINSTTQCDSDGFDTAKLFLRRALAEAAWLQAYPKRVKNGATAMLSQAASETNEVQSKLAEFKRRFIKHEKGGKVDLSELKDSFEANIESRYKAARALIANLPAQERDLKRDREQWLKDYTTAVESAEAYFELVAGTGTKFGPGWDEKHIKKMDSDKNLSNIGTEMAKRYPRTYIDILYNGWQPNSQIKVRIEDVQVWVQSVSKEKVIVQFRAFDNRGVIVPKGTDSIPHWHAVHLGLFHYFAKQVKDENFENNYLCFEFFVRPTWFKKMTEAGGGGASVDFLKGEVDKIVPLWKPEWAKQLVHETKRGIVKNPLKRRKALATQLRDVLGTTEAYQSESEWFQKLFSME